MKATKEQMRARVMAAAATVADKLLAWDETVGAPDLEQIEEEVLKLRAEFGQALLAAELAGQEAQQPAAVQCPACGAEMRYKGRKAKQVASLAGDLAIERGYYYCPRCKQGIFPPGSPVGDRSPGVE